MQVRWLEVGCIGCVFCPGGCSCSAAHNSEAEMASSSRASIRSVSVLNVEEVDDGDGLLSGMGIILLNKGKRCSISLLMSWSIK